MAKSEFSRLKDENGGDVEATSKPSVAGVFEVFRFASWSDRVLMIIGCLAAIINGSGIPIATFVFGEILDVFVSAQKLRDLLDDIPEFLALTNMTKDDVLDDQSLLEFRCDFLSEFYNGSKNCDDLDFDSSLIDDMKDNSLYFTFVAIGVMFSSWVQVATWSIAAERQSYRIRKAFFKNILRQDIGWYDMHEASELNSRLSADIVKIEGGFGEGVSNVIQYCSTFIFGYIIGFYINWKLSAVVLSLSPAIIGAGALFSSAAATMSAQEQTAYAKAGAIAEEALGAIRTVVAFGGEDKESNRYEQNLDDAAKIGRKKGVIFGASLGASSFVMFASYALGLWYGGKLTREDDDLTIGDVMVVYFCVTVGTFILGQAASSVEKFSTCRGAAKVVYDIIDLVPTIDSSSDAGKVPELSIGNISLRNVHFCYPSRPDVRILQGLSLEARPGQTVALVGASGCGKSTTVQLLLRFYDPQNGQVCVDGNDVKDLNIEWLRRSIGLVSQEPVLFDTSIEENIRYGREDVTTEEIYNAARTANAFDFIMELPEKFDTLVGERGAQLSGGQKQRIAIARALVRDPRILLLDEATSALDTESEAIVQNALEKARQGRTTIVIAHRLSTIKTSDVIIGLDKGVVVEKGTHEQLMAANGIYYTLVTNQTNESDAAFSDDLGDGADFSAASNKVEMKRLLSKEEEKAPEEKKEDLKSAPFSKLMKMNYPERCYIFIGCMAAAINGTLQPLFALIYSEVLEVFAEDEDEQKDEIQKNSLLILGIGFVALAMSILQSSMFSIAGEALTKRLRGMTFKSMMRQEIAWHDLPHNTTGELTTRLASDASLVQGATGTRIGSFLMALTCLGTALTLAFIYGWKLTFAVLGCFPLMMAAGMGQTLLISGAQAQSKEAVEEAGKIAVESVVNIRTVAALSKEEHFVAKFKKTLLPAESVVKKKSFVMGLAYGVAQSLLFFSIALILYVGALLVDDGDMTAGDVFKVFNIIMYGGVSLGQAFAFTPDITKAQVSAKRVFTMLERQSTVDVYSDKGDILHEDTFRSTVSFQNAKFAYPLRPEVQVLQGFNLRVEPGHTVALVGSSGCGKSTSISLLERFYELQEGSVTLDNHPIQALNLRWLRSQMGLVSQEPVLFDRSIAENIAYGDNSRLVPMDEIVRAARAANIHNFIDALPEGYETNVGDKGTQLSGGQKQRVAIARALVRNPKILLLDEATSALDTESEKVVQEALDRARAGRTCITIAHRLSTIQDADQIVVIHKGVAVEQGTHEELMDLGGFYSRLQRAQRKNAH